MSSEEKKSTSDTTSAQLAYKKKRQMLRLRRLRMQAKKGVGTEGTGKKELEKSVVKMGKENSSFTLTDLPLESLHTILDYLEVPELCTSARVSKLFRSAADDWTLWSARYVERWPVRCAPEDRRKFRWKHKYRVKDLEETNIADIPLETRSLWNEMSRLKRESSDTKRARNEFEIVNQWRENHPLVKLWETQPDDDDTFVKDNCKNSIRKRKRFDDEDDTPLKRRGRKHICHYSKCTYFSSQDLYICNTSGKVHFCDSQCDRVGKHGICVVTGLRKISSDTGFNFVDEDEIDEAKEGEEEDSMGFFARMYTLGYHMKSEFSKSMFCNTDVEQANQTYVYKGER